MLKRKIYQELLEWKSSKDKSPLIIKGMRQVGKTYIVKQFAQDNYSSVIYIDFRNNDKFKKIFDGGYDVDTIMLYMSVLLPDYKYVENDTLIIFDEIQDCFKARESLKSFKIDGRFDVICTGSLLGIKGYNRKLKQNIPVGYEETKYLKSLDFEEFLWANGIDEKIIDIVKDCYRNNKKIPIVIHEKLTELFKIYICVGGMPSVVNEYLQTKNFNKVLNMQRNLIESYKDDFGRHIDENDDSYIDNKELGHILAVFDSLTNQLSKEYKKFQYKLVNGRGRNEDYRYGLQWLIDAGLVIPCYNLTNLELPLEGNKIDNEFKIYFSDSGLLVSMLEEGTQADILNNNLLIYKGAIYENIIADIFDKLNRKLYYFRKNSGLEIDFVTRYKGKCTPIEVKARNSKAKSFKTVIDSKDTYHINFGIKFKDSNISLENEILYLPLYCSFLIDEY